jgi:hypothetical protein
VEQGASYRIVSQREGSIALVFIMPVLFAAWIFLERDAPLRHTHPSEFPYAIAFMVAFGLAVEAYVVLHRRRARSSRLMVEGEGLSFYEGSKMRWRIGWAELDSAVLRKYILRYSYFNEAIVLTTKNGKTRIVPTASILYGRMPDLDALSERLRERGYPVGKDHRPLWLAPS